MPMIISLLVPTRKRPASMERVWKSANETAIKPLALQIVFYIDEDDIESIEKLQQMIKEEKNAHGTNSMRVDGVIGRRIIVGSDMWNRAYESAIGELLFFGGDDVIFRTKGWDNRVREEFKRVDDKILYVHPYDGLRTDDLGTHGFLHRNWINATGFVTPPCYIFYRSDRWLTKTAKQLGRDVFIKDVLIEHVHFSKNKSVKDSTYSERIEMFKGNTEDAIKKFDLYDNRGKTASMNDPIKSLKEVIARYEFELQKVFCIGLPRTGTATLASNNGALSQLGYKGKTIHQSNDLLKNYPYYNHPLYDSNYVFADFPIPALYKELDKKYSKSKFILTTRPTDDWLDSTEAIFKILRGKWGKFIHKFNEDFYGSSEFNRDLFGKKYERHNNEVIEYFTNESESELLILPIKEFGWKVLHEFINPSGRMPKTPFPHKNRRDQIDKRRV